MLGNEHIKGDFKLNLLPVLFHGYPEAYVLTLQNLGQKTPTDMSERPDVYLDAAFGLHYPEGLNAYITLSKFPYLLHRRKTHGHRPRGSTGHDPSSLDTVPTSASISATYLRNSFLYPLGF